MDVKAELFVKKTYIILNADLEKRCWVEQKSIYFIKAPEKEIKFHRSYIKFNSNQHYSR